ncbi:hypothetical protein NliqN6_6495 [Naganishia liquefaciens]|uniref:N-acetyltransferase domain-containing protein n=1 Tax=Naganishia liquefaciens TaxID=104408 RepID=A0A8H3U0B5_9TREE|nr:hypothetical protein NliqN6_6495 [Naganishia liquefaciens]
MNILIRPAKTSQECIAVGEIFHQACNKLKWHGLVYSQVDPEDKKRYVTQLARIIRKTHHGVVILAELEGKIVGYLLAWEINANRADPYRHKMLIGKPPGKDASVWQDLSSQVDNVCNQLQEKLGPLLYVDKVGVLPSAQGYGVGRRLMEYTIMAAQAATFYSRMRFKKVGEPIKLTSDSAAQLFPMLLENGEWLNKGLRAWKNED